MSSYLSTVELASRTPLFWMLVAMLVTFLATRVVTRRIRGGAAALGNRTFRGVHGWLLVGFTPLDLSGARHELLAYLAAGFLINLILSVTCLFKGKPVLGFVGLLVPSIAFIGALRLAKPGSQWAAWRYSAASGKRERAERRFGPAYEARWNRIRDVIGGAPDV